MLRFHHSFVRFIKYSVCHGIVIIVCLHTTMSMMLQCTWPTTTIPNVFELGAHSLYISCRLLLYICTMDPLSVMSWRTCDVMNPGTTVYTGDNLGRSSGIPYIGRTRSRVTRFHVAGRLVGSKGPYLLGDS